MGSERVCGLTILVCIAAAVSAVPNPARAYRTLADEPDLESSTPIVFASPPMWNLAPSGVDARTLTQLESAARAAVATWSRPECSAFSAMYAGNGAIRAVPGDGISTIEVVRSGWVDRGFDTSHGAFTDLQLERVGDAYVVREADLYLDFENHRWGFLGEERRLDTQAVIVHEWGHALGLVHPCRDPGAPACTEEHRLSAMYPEYLGVSQRELGADDWMGVCALYPRASECHTCSATEECVAGLCRPEPCEGAECGGPVSCERDADCGSAGTCAVGGYRAGECVLRASEGTACMIGEHCRSGLCLTAGGASYCTTSCVTDLQCHRGDQCTEVAGRAVCAPRPARSSGCAVGPPRTRPGIVCIAFILAAGAILHRRRTR